MKHGLNWINAQKQVRIESNASEGIVTSYTKSLSSPLYEICVRFLVGRIVYVMTQVKIKNGQFSDRAGRPINM